MSRATTPRKPPPALTPEQLQLALRQLWRPGWPRDLQVALAHHTYGICIRGLARNLHRAAVCTPRVDIKRNAANDKD